MCYADTNLALTLFIMILSNLTYQILTAPILARELCTYQCKPRGGGSAGKGRGFDGEVHPLSGRFDRVPLLGGRDI